MWQNRSLGWPITLGVVMIVLLVALTIGWIVVTVAGWQTTNRAAYVAVLAVGTTFLALLLVGVVLYLLISVKEIRLNQRQANFIDSVTHELKSPIASLKLYLQTLDRHKLPEQQQADFHRFMLEDVERLDRLIDHLLDAARLNHQPSDEPSDVNLAEVLTNCANAANQQYGLAADAIRLQLEPAVVRARQIDVQMVCRNLIDNAIKYSGETPRVEIDCSSDGNGRVITRIMDNGPGIPPKLRRMIFGRFVRLGSELERSQAGMGLGLYIVRTLVKRMDGKITVRDRTDRSGTIFELELPAGTNVQMTNV